MNELPWDRLFGLLFMTMGPIRAIAVFGRVGTDDADPAVKALADRAALLTAAAFLLTVLIGPRVLESWGISFPVLIAAGGIVLGALSLQALLAPPQGGGPIDPAATQPAAIAFPGLFPPIAVAVPLILGAPFQGQGVTAGIATMGLGIVAVNWLLMRRSKAILRAIGPVPLQLFGAVFGVLQLALALRFLVSAAALL